MTRVAAVLLVLASTAIGAPKGKDPPPPAYYFPTTVGAEWVYRRQADGKAGERTDRVTAVARKGDVLVVTVEHGRYGPRRLGVSGRGLTDPVNADGTPAGGPQRVFLPGRPGDAWEEGDWTLTNAGEEAVEVPAGAVRAVRVDSVRELPANRVSVHVARWYAPGIGLVQQVTRLRGHDDGGTRVLDVEVLASFRPGTKD